MSKAITDTGPPLHLNQIGYIYLLGIFEAIVVSGQVKKELQEYNTWDIFKEQRGFHIQEEVISDTEIMYEQDNWIHYKLQSADLSILLLARRIRDTFVLTDDLQLRGAIESLGRIVIGSVGILLRGYKEQKLNRDELHKCVDLLFNDSSLYLSRAFRRRVLQLVEELEKE